MDLDHRMLIPSHICCQVATSYLPTLATVRDAIDAQLVGIQGAFVEDNIFSVSVHYRKCPNHEEIIPRIKAIVDEELARTDVGPQ